MVLHVAACKIMYADYAFGAGTSDYGPPIAWFTDPAGNVLSVLEEASAG